MILHENTGVSYQPVLVCNYVPFMYLRSPRGHLHYMGRYFGEALEPAAQNARIKVLMQTYLATMRDLGVQTWLMHGSLLGWWWGKKVRAQCYTVKSSNQATRLCHGTWMPMSPRL